MRILTLSQRYEPEPGVICTALGKELKSRGHDVTAITGFPNYPGGKLFPGYRIRWRQREQIDGINVLRLPLYPDHSYSAPRRIMNYSSFAASATLIGPWLSGKADVMWVYHPPLTVGIPAWWIGLLRRIPFIFEVQDMWPETLRATGMFHSRKGTAMISALARFIYERASAITVISPGFKRNLVDKGVATEKIHVIPNWADEKIFRPLARDEKFAAAHGMSGKFNVVFGGNVGAAQALDNVLAAAALLKEAPLIQFVIIGGGIAREGLVRRCREMGLTNVIFIDRQPFEKMPRFFAQADVLLVHLKNDPLFEITIPSKTIAYLACGRPVICAVAGDAAEVIKKSGAGLVCPPEDPWALAVAAMDLASMNQGERARLGESGRRAYLAEFTKNVLVNRYEKLFNEIASAGKGVHGAGY